MSCSGDRTLAIWDVATGDRLDTLYGHELEVWMGYLLSDGKTPISGSKDGSVWEWDISIPHPRPDRIEFPIDVRDWSFSHGGTSIVTLDWEGRVQRWQGERLRDTETILEIDPSNQVAGRYSLSEDGREIAITATNRVCRFIDFSQPTERFTFGDPVSSFQRPATFISSDWLVTFSGDEAGEIWNVETGDHALSVKLVPNLWFVDYHPNDDYFAQIGFNRRVRLIPRSGGGVTDLTLDFYEGENGVFSPDGKWFAVASHIGHARVWDSETWEVVATAGPFLLGRDSVNFSPYGRRMNTGGGSLPEEAFRLFDTSSWLDVLTLRCEGSHFVLTRFSPDGNAIGMMDSTRTLTVWTAPSWEEIAPEESQKSVRSRMD